MVRVKEVCYVVCILSNPKCTDVELEILGDILKESFCMGSDAGMIPWTPNSELEVVNILKGNMLSLQQNTDL